MVGFVAPELGKALKPLGTGFVDLIKMMISPVIFCTIVLGIGSIRQAAKVGKVGGLALLYFIAMSTVALVIGLLVGNILHPGEGLVISEAGRAAAEKAASGEAQTTTEFLLGIIPTTLVSPLVGESVLRRCSSRCSSGSPSRGSATPARPVLRGIKHFERVVFRVLSMIMWVAPIGAFGAIAAVVGETGWSALVALGQIMLGFYITCFLFVVLVLGMLLRAVTGLSIFKLMKYLGREYLLIVSTSSSESALPRLIAKMEHMGVSRPVVGITVPTGYSFNLDGTAIYLTMASLFIASALGNPLSVGEQISLLLFMMIASKGAAGVTGAGLATLAGGLSAHRPDLVDGVGLIVGIDRFMSEARALTNFSGNAVATLLIGKWVGEIDSDRARRVLDGERPVRRGHHDRRRRGPAAGRAAAARARGPGTRRPTPPRSGPAPPLTDSRAAPRSRGGGPSGGGPRPVTISDTVPAREHDAMTESPQMPEGTYELVRSTDGGYTARISARGMAVLASPTINRGTAFTLGTAPRARVDRAAARRGEHAGRAAAPDVCAVRRAGVDDLAKWVYLTNLRDRNEVLFYKLLSEHIEEMLPIVYTPTVGLAIERFSVSSAARGGCTCRWTTPRTSRPRCATPGWAPRTSTCWWPPTPRASSGSATRVWAASRSRSASSRCTPRPPGIHPSRVLPVVLDVGTDNLALLNDEMYLGERHARVRDGRYDELIEAYVSACQKLFPQRDAALGGLRRVQRPADPGPVRRAGVHVQRRHAGHRRGRAGGGVLRGARGRGRGCATSGW